MYHIDSLKIENLYKLSKEYNICPICLGRLNYNSSKNFFKETRKLYTFLYSKKNYSYYKSKKCYLCNNITLRFSRVIYEILAKIESYEFNSFSVGTMIPEILQAREDFIRSKYNLFSGSSLKSFLNYFMALFISRLTGKEYRPSGSDIKILYDFREDRLELIPNSIYIYGRYIKLRRGIRQTRQYCKFCYGLGCKYCSHRGFTEDPSIEGYVLYTFRDEFFGEETVLHAAGREDIDVITLNTGRPFVIEIKRPLKRELDLQKIQEKLNSMNEGIVLIKGLKYVNREVMERINVYSKYDEKTYRLLVRFKEKINESIIKKIEKELSNRVIAQRTPLRVIYRRADKVRYKMVYSINSKIFDDYTVEFIIRCQGGLYIKELAHGDQDRTNPSIYSITNIPLEVVSLDVISVAPELEKRLGLDYT